MRSEESVLIKQVDKSALSPKTNIFIFAYCILFLTPLRSVVILFMPILVLGIGKFLGLTITKRVVFLFLLMMISSFWGLLLGTTYVPNVILSFYIVFPVIYVLFGHLKNSEIANLFINRIFKYTERILYFINSMGFIRNLLYGYDDDAFDIGYGMHFERMNGLAIINLLVLIRLISLFNYQKRNGKYYVKLLFFLFSFICCSYGAGLIMAFLTVLIYIATSFNIKMLFRFIVICSFLLVTIVSVHSNYFSYYIRSVDLIVETGEENGDARKLTMFIKSWDLLKEHPVIFATIGLGPGSYNSRICNLLNKDADNPFTAFLGGSMSPYYSKYIYPLWNKKTAVTEDGTDGGRNKPMSSFISILFEYGFPFFLLFYGSMIYRLVKERKLVFKDVKSTYLFYSSLFMLLLCLSEQWLETSEFLYFSVLYVLYRHSKSSSLIEIK